MASGGGPGLGACRIVSVELAPQVCSRRVTARAHIVLRRRKGPPISARQIRSHEMNREAAPVRDPGDCAGVATRSDECRSLRECNDRIGAIGPQNQEEAIHE